MCQLQRLSYTVAGLRRKLQTLRPSCTLTMTRARLRHDLPVLLKHRLGCAGEAYQIRRRSAGDPRFVVSTPQYWIGTLYDAHIKRRTRAALKSGPAPVWHAGTAVFLSISRAVASITQRLDVELVSYTLKAVLRRAHEAGVRDAREDGRLSKYRNHSFRAGFVTTADEKNIPAWQFQKVTRHMPTAVLRSFN